MGGNLPRTAPGGVAVQVGEDEQRVINLPAEQWASSPAPDGGYSINPLLF